MRKEVYLFRQEKMKLEGKGEAKRKGKERGGKRKGKERTRGKKGREELIINQTWY